MGTGLQKILKRVNNCLGSGNYTVAVAISETCVLVHLKVESVRFHHRVLGGGGGEVSGVGELGHGVVKAGHGIAQDGSAGVNGLLHARVLGGGSELGRVSGELGELINGDAEGELEKKLWVVGVGLWEGGDARQAGVGVPSDVTHRLQ